MKKYTHLSLGQRYKIEALLATPTPISKREIAQIIGVHVSTVYREIKRNSIQKSKGPNQYKAGAAHNFSKRRAYKPWNQKTKNSDIRRRIFWLLKHGWSPEQIAETCKKRKVPMLSTEAIYQVIYMERKKGNDLTGYLRRGHRRRRKRRLDKQPRVIIKNKVSIHERPKIIDKQKRVGDFEIDLVQCKKGYLLTITERKTLYNIIEKLPNKKSIIVQEAIIKALKSYKGKIYSITSDNGTEFANHEAIAKRMNLQWYFADPYKSQQRGCNENQNGLIREYFKRETNLNSLTREHIKSIQQKINARPRKKNDFISPSKAVTLAHQIKMSHL